MRCGHGSGGRRGEQDLFRSRLDQIIDLKHALVKLARAIDWRFLEEQFGAVYTDGPGRPPLPTRLMAGLAILKHTYDLSDEALCERWVENPYFQFFCGEEFFQHRLPFDRSSLTRWRQRMGEEKLTALLQESLAVATRTGAVKPSDFARGDRRHDGAAEGGDVPDRRQADEPGARGWCGWPSRPASSLRQSYARVGKLALIKHQRYAHAKQFKRANRSLRKLKTYLGRVIRDIGRQIDGDAGLEEIFARPLSLARRVLEQEHRQRGPQGLFPACAGGRMHRQGQGAPALRVRRQGLRRHHRSSARKGGQFVAHVKALPGNPYDGHTLATVIPDIEAHDRQHHRAHPRRCRLSRPQCPARLQVQGLHRQARSDGSRRRSSASSNAAPPSSRSSAISRTSTAWAATISPTASGDAINAVLAAAGYNFRRLLRG